MVMQYRHKIKSPRLGVPALIGSLLITITLMGCDESGPKLSDESHVDAERSEINSNYRWVNEEDLALLKSADIFNVRMAISNISTNNNEDVTSHLIELWNNDGFLFEQVNKDAVTSPVVRLTLAQSIIQKGVNNDEYTDYIKKHVYSDNIVVKTVASEALRDIYSEDALYMLREVADSQDEKIAEIAISGIKHQTIFGENREVASSLWKDLGDSNTRYKEVMAKYDEMYDGYLQERERRIKEGFVPAE